MLPTDTTAADAQDQLFEFVLRGRPDRLLVKGRSCSKLADHWIVQTAGGETLCHVRIDDAPATPGLDGLLDRWRVKPSEPKPEPDKTT